MTLVAAWIRKTPGGEEMIVASDSRLTGGIRLDNAPKIFRLLRNDSVLAYCGQTLVAYPIVLQIKAGLDAYDETRNRVVDIVELKSHVEKLIESLRGSIQDLPSKDGADREFKFMLAGYSWRTNAFRIWIFKFDLVSGEFNAYSKHKESRFAFMSDRSENEYGARKNLLERIARDSRLNKKRLDWEPLKTLLDFIQNETIGDIGGPPQIVKIYRHANILPINISWLCPETRDGIKRNVYRVSHLGRPLLEYENSRYLTLDTNSWEFVEPWKIRQRLDDYNQQEEAKLKAALITSLLVILRHVRDRRLHQQCLNELIKDSRPYSELCDEMMRYRNRKADSYFANEP